MTQHSFLLGLLLITVNPAVAEETKPIPVGIAKVEVTPNGPVLLAGYGGRTTEHEGIDTPLWARALVIGGDKPVAIVVVDNCGITANFRQRLVVRLKDQGVTADRLVVAATHTHNAPTLSGYANIVWSGRATLEQESHVTKYTDFLIDKAHAAIVQALANRQPMLLEWTQGRAHFGGNRRQLTNGTWTGFGFQREGPVDHSLPIIAARDLTGKLRAVWANYACHCTTVGSRNRVGGDWAGYANDWIETTFPQAMSLITIGCGADIGPQPSGSLKIAEQHGRSIAKQVKLALDGSTKQLRQVPQVSNRLVALPLAHVRTRAEWEQRLLNDNNAFHREHAKSMLAKIDKSGSLPSTVDYFVSSWTFANDLAIVFLGGEVVVDYSVRLNQELDWSRLWITAWANSMPGYIPSRRVLLEGGYEADFSQIYYDQPGPYALDVEEVLVASITDLLGNGFKAKATQQPADFHASPSGERIAFQKLSVWSTSPKSDEEAAIADWIQHHLPISMPAGSTILQNDGETTEWYNFAGDFTRRAFLRQQTLGAELRWQLAEVSANRDKPITVCFTGGVGWSSEPQTAGFAISINGRSEITFDVTRKPSRWRSDDGRAELVYLPTWKSNTDSAGFFFLRVVDSRQERNGIIRVRSLGNGSKRWFAVDSNQEIEDQLKHLAAALKDR